MIGLYVKVPYHAQIRSSEPQLAERMAEAAAEAASSFAGAPHPAEESFFMSFDEGERPCRLRAAQAARSLSARLRELGARLLGWAVILDVGPGDAEEALERARRLWYGVQADGLYLSERAAAFFSGYFSAGSASSPAGSGLPAVYPAADAPYARPAIPLDLDSILPECGRGVDDVVDAIGDIVTDRDGDEALAILGPGRSALAALDEALGRLYPEAARPFLRLGASVVGSRTYWPFAKGLSELFRSYRDEAGIALSKADRGLLEELSPVLEFLRRSPYRERSSRGIEVRLSICASALVKLYAREMGARSLPALVVIEGAEDFPAESLSLLLGIARDKLKGEGVVIIACGRSLPESWAGAPTRRVEVSGPGPSEMAQAALRGAEALGDASLASSLVSAAATDPLRLRLALRVASTGGRLPESRRAEDLASLALSTFPLEYAELFLALRLGEDILDDEGMDGFLASMGYVAGIRDIAYAALAALGLAGPGPRPRLRSAEAASRAESALGDRGEAVKAAFSRRLLALRESRGILASLALYRRVSGIEGADGSAYSLLYECLASDAAYGPSESEGLGPLRSPLWPLGAFLARYAEADREGSLSALERLEAESAAGAGSLVSISAALSRAAFDYAELRAQEAASRAKSALIGLRSLGVVRAEARAHRLLGLCALAQGEAQEGADYLANAFDLASSVPDPMECALSAQAEAAAQLALGDINRASHRAAASAEWARAAFRADWEAAAEFIAGRAALELGNSAAAEEKFGSVRSLARIYGLPAAALRAEVWTGRAAAFAGDLGRARDILGRRGEDVEALWFLGEAECWRGDCAAAAALASRALELIPPAPFASADAFDWASGFGSLEGRVVGFRSARTYLADQVLAFREYSAALADPAAEAQARAARISALEREERISALHPSAHLYAFYRYRILERAGAGAMDATTALSKAFKALQTRSARTVESSLKDGFMERNRWNGELMAAARARKLM